MPLDPSTFRKTFERFQKLVSVYSGHEFTNLNEGLAAVWEGYKPRLRDLALAKLDALDWQHETIGRGRILELSVVKTFGTAVGVI